MDLVVPVATLTGPGGQLDLGATTDYARAFADWSPDATALLCGSTGSGDSLPARSRARVFGAWAEVLPPARLMCCAWDTGEAAALAARGRRVLLAVAGPVRTVELAAMVRAVGPGAYLYSHPRFGWTLTAAMLCELRARGAEPGGVKLSKCTLDDVRAHRRAAGSGLRLWDGSARRVRESLAAGADGVVAGCLAALPGRGPADPGQAQRMADGLLRELDGLPDRAARLRWTADRVRELLRARGSSCSG